MQIKSIQGKSNSNIPAIRYSYASSSLASITENLAGESRKSQIANSKLAKLNAETPSLSPINLISVKKMCPLSSVRSVIIKNKSAAHSPLQHETGHVRLETGDVRHKTGDMIGEERQGTSEKKRKTGQVTQEM